MGRAGAPVPSGDEIRGIMIDIALVVVTFNSATHLNRLLTSLDPALGNLRARVVFVDNNSSDDTVARLRGDSRVEVLDLAENRGFAAAVNVGLERTSPAPAVLVLNPDLVLAPGSISKLLAVGREPGVGIVVPQIRRPNGEIFRSIRREPTVSRALGVAVMGGRVARYFSGLSETVGDHRSYLRCGDVEWATGAAMLVTRQCVDATGPWDESFFLYSEETDFAYRARQAGFRLRFEPSAVVTHTGGDGMASPRLRSMLVLNRVRYFRRRHGRTRSTIFFSAVLLNEVTRGVIGNRAARAAAHALIHPRVRPEELACSGRLIPR
jgi:GT2 family glycosyltransferase